MIEWLEKELEATRGRVDALEAVALHFLAQSEGLLRARPDPEMRPFLVAAFSNVIRRPEVFRPTWVRRLTSLLHELGADHLGFLVERMKAAESRSAKGFDLSRTPGDWLSGDADGLLVLQELLGKLLLQRPQAASLTRGIYLTPVGGMLAEFVGAPEPRDS